MTTDAEVMEFNRQAVEDIIRAAIDQLGDDAPPLAEAVLAALPPAVEALRTLFDAADAYQAPLSHVFVVAERQPRLKRLLPPWPRAHIRDGLLAEVVAAASGRSAPHASVSAALTAALAAAEAGS